MINDYMAEMITNGIAFYVAIYTLVILGSLFVKAYLNFILNKSIDSYEKETCTVYTLRHAFKMVGCSIKKDHNPISDRYDIHTPFGSFLSKEKDDVFMFTYFLPLALAFTTGFLVNTVMTHEVPGMILLGVVGFFTMSLVIRKAVIKLQDSMKKHVKEYHGEDI